jgi:hypothetical protein
MSVPAALSVRASLSATVTRRAGAAGALNGQW